MLIKKVIEVGLNIKDIINTFTDDNNILSILSEIYENKCFRECYIKSVDTLNRMGDCVINQEGSPDFGVMPIVFTATALVYTPGEVINGCLVKSRSDTGILICVTSTASIYINPHISLNSIIPGQIISVVVGATCYSIGSSTISVNAMPFLPNTIQRLYKLSNIELDQRMLVGVLSKIKDEEDLMVSLQTKEVYVKFRELLYPYKTKLNASGTKINISTFASYKFNVGDTIGRDIKDSFVNNTMRIYSTADIPATAELHSEVLFTGVILLLLEDYYNQMRILRELTEIYTPEILTTHKNVLQILTKYKLEV